MNPSLCFTYQGVVDIINGPLIDRYKAPHWLTDAITRMELGLKPDGKLVHVIKNGVGWRVEDIETSDLVYFDEWVMKVKIIKGV